MLRFNLASLLVALLITGVLTLSLLPLALTTEGAAAVERGAGELARELEAARQLAAARGGTYQVQFDWARGAYYISVADILVPSRRVLLPPGVEWGAVSTNPLVFIGSGRCLQGGTYTLKHRHCGYRVDVVVATHSGRVRLDRRAP